MDSSGCTAALHGNGQLPGHSEEERMSLPDADLGSLGTFNNTRVAQALAFT